MSSRWDIHEFCNFEKGIQRNRQSGGDYYVFDIGGNKYRLIAAIHFNTQKLFIREVMTHKEYNKWVP
jgi:mRNA interferase HigB